MAKDQEVRGVQEADDAELGALVGKAADQLRLVGGRATATVRFCVDDQWFECTLRMIDVVEVPE
jgi:hypothetical protein